MRTDEVLKRKRKELNLRLIDTYGHKFTFYFCFFSFIGFTFVFFLDNF